MKIAFDVHGVIDKYPNTIYPMIILLHKMGNEICIISGPSKKLIQQDLEKLDFYNKTRIGNWVEICSVVDFLKNTGVHTWEDKNGNVWADDQNWWDSKAKICKRDGIDYIIDDSEKYKSAFELIDCKFIHISELIMSMKKAKVFVVPNYSNDDYLIEFIKKCNGIKSDCNLRRGPFSGCDVPQVLDIEYKSIDDLKKFKDGFSKIATDNFWIENYSFICET